MKSIIFGIVFAIVSFNVLADCKSDGFRSGVVQKFSKKGTFAKSWEGELVMAGQDNFKGANIWKFSASDQAVANDLETAIMSQAKVVVKYCEGYFAVSTDTHYNVVKVVFSK